MQPSSAEVIQAVDDTCFDGTCFDGACFDGACFDGACFDGACFDGACFDGACFDGTCFDGTCFDETKFVPSFFSAPRRKHLHWESSSPLTGSPGVQRQHISRTNAGTWGWLTAPRLIMVRLLIRQHHTSRSEKSHWWQIRSKEFHLVLKWSGHSERHHSF